MSKTIELVRQEVETIKNEVEDFANSASRIGEAMSDILEYNKELTETEANRAKDVEQSLSEEIDNIKEAISNIGGEGGEGSKEVTRAEFELVKVESKGTFDAFSQLGMTEKADADGYEIALAKATNTAEKTKVKVPVFDVQNMAKNPAGLVNEVFVEDMASMMDEKIEDALMDFTPPEGEGSNVTIVQETGASTTDVMSQKAVTDAIDNLAKEVGSNSEDTIKNADNITTLARDLGVGDSPAWPIFDSESSYKAGDIVRNSESLLFKLTVDYDGDSSTVDEYTGVPATAERWSVKAGLEDINNSIDTLDNRVSDIEIGAENTGQKADMLIDYSGFEQYSEFDSGGTYAKGDIVRMLVSDEEGNSWERLVRLTADYNGSGTPQYEPWNLVLDTERAKTPDNMGYVILRKDLSFAEQVTKENTIYEVRYDFSLGGETVTIPSGCVLKFEGGVLKNGIINAINLKIDAESTSLDAVSFVKKTLNDRAYADWYVYKEGDDIAPVIANCFTMADSVELNSSKEYTINSTIVIENGQLLLCDRNIKSRSSEYGQLNGNSRGCILKANVYPCVKLFSGGALVGGHFKPSAEMGNNNSYIHFSLKENGSNIYNNTYTYIQNVILGENISTYVENAKGVGITCDDANYELYGLRIDNMVAFNLYNILVANGAKWKARWYFNIYGFNCRHACDLYNLNEVEGDIICQGRPSSVNADDLSVATFVFKKCSGVVGVKNWDAQGYDSADKFYFNNIIEIKESPLLIVKPVYAESIIDMQRYTNMFVNLDGMAKLGRNSYKENDISNGYNYFDSMLPNEDYTVTMSEGVSTASGVTINSVYGDRRYPTGHYIYSTNAETDYIEFNFDIFKTLRAVESEIEQERNLQCFGIGVTFDNAPAAEYATPLMVLVTMSFAYPQYSANKHVQSVCIYAPNKSVAEISDIYQDILPDGTIYLEANSFGEYYIDRIDRILHNGVANALKMGLVSLNIKLYGSTGTYIRLSDVIISVPANYSKTRDLFTRSNKWRGKQAFNGLVINRGNSGTARPRLTAGDIGTSFFDTNINKPIWWTGTGWVDATGATV